MREEKIEQRRGNMKKLGLMRPEEGREEGRRKEV